MIDDYLTSEAQAISLKLSKQALNAADVRALRNQRLVRGFDYYRHTAFEFIPDERSEAAGRLGSQSTVLGGGRYDGLIEALGGPHTPAVGWAAGIERLAMLVGEMEVAPPEFVIIVEDDALIPRAIKALSVLRSKGFSADMVATGSPKKRFDKAVKMNPQEVITMTSDGIRINKRLKDTYDEYKSRRLLDEIDWAKV